MPSLPATLLSLLTLNLLAHVHADSAVFSQFIGATTVTVPSDPTLSASLSLCTNYLHGLPALTGLTNDYSMQVEQVAVDGVCRFCTSVDQSRIDSCCGQATSSACFDQFAAVQTTPASASAKVTATSLGGATSTPTQSSNGGGMVQNKDFFIAPLVGSLVGLVAWVL